MKRIKELIDVNEEERVRRYVERYEKVLDGEGEEGLERVFEKKCLGTMEGGSGETEVHEFYRLAERVRMAGKRKERAK